jgi:hypothetical protein
MTLRHPVEDIDLTKDGRALAVGAGALQVFDLGIERGRVKFSQRFSAFDQEERSGVPVFQEQFGQVAISPNGEVVAAAASSPGPLAPAAGHVALFVLRDGQRIAQLQTPKPANGNTETGRYTITTVAFSPDGTLLAAGGKERVVTLWMAATDRASANGQANSGGSKPPLLGNDAKPAPRLQFRLVAGEKDTAPFEEMPDPGDKTGKRTLRLLKEVLLDESAVAAAAATPGQGAGKQITLALTTAGAERFAQITGNNINRRLAIVFDGKVISAPVIKSRISGIGVITGDFSEEEVARIVKALNRPVAGGQFRAK